MSIASRVSAAISVLRGKAPVGTVTSGDFGYDFGWRTISDGPQLGSWQQDIQWSPRGVTAYWAFYSCVTLIASDVGKLCLRLVEQAAGTWQEADGTSPFWGVLRKPNSYQTRQQFFEQWMISKLIEGNAYVLKQRDQRGIVTDLYILHPRLCHPYITPKGEVFYQVSTDNLARIREPVMVPASEIIHDRAVPLFHPLVGISPIYACGLAAMQGLKIQQNAARFFQNMSRPSGILTTPGELTDPLAQEYRKRWNENYGGDKIGNVAVLGNGLSYQGITSNAIDSQLVEQLKITAEMVCSTLHVPSFKIGAGVIPAGQKVDDLNLIYYSDCLQSHLESIENLLDEGLGIGAGVNIGGRVLGVEFDLDDLLKMDTASKVDYVDRLSTAGVLKPNEGRAMFGLLPVTGGDSPLKQQQNFSLAALAKRDALPNPFVIDRPTANPTPSPTGPAVTADPTAADQSAKEVRLLVEKVERHIEEAGTKQADLFAETVRSLDLAKREAEENVAAHEFVAELVKRFDAESLL